MSVIAVLRSIAQHTPTLRRNEFICPHTRNFGLFVEMLVWIVDGRVSEWLAGGAVVREGCSGGMSAQKALHAGCVNG